MHDAMRDEMRRNRTMACAMLETAGFARGTCGKNAHWQQEYGRRRQKKTLMIVIKVFDLEARPGIEPGLTALQAAT